MSNTSPINWQYHATLFSPFASQILIPSLPQFYAKYPDIQLHLGVSDRVVDLIDENVDCVVRGVEVTNQSLIARHVGDLPLGVYAAPSYLAKAGMPVHPSELEAPHHRLVGYLGSRTRRIFSPTMHCDGERIAVQGSPALVVDDGNAFIAAGVAGLGALWFPTYMAEPYVARGELVQLFAHWQLDPMPLYIAFPPNRHVSAKLRVFIDWVVELMAQHLPAK